MGMTHARLFRALLQIGDHVRAVLGAVEVEEHLDAWNEGLRIGQPLVGRLPPGPSEPYPDTVHLGSNPGSPTAQAFSCGAGEASHPQLCGVGVA